VSESKTTETDRNEQQDESSEHQDTQPAEMTTEEGADPSDVDTDNTDAKEEVAGILAVQKTLRSTASQLVGHEFDGVSEISPMDKGWSGTIEVVERSSVPDTQDVIGRYKIELDSDGVVQGYRRLDRYRRGDTTMFE
jgi:hypothetical protein